MDQQKLHTLLSYDADTGVFRWRDRRLDALSKNRAGFLTSAGYWASNVERRRHFAHRLAWVYVHGALPAGDIDHINGIRTDNRISNLRDVPHQVNCQNQRTGRRGGLLGTSYHPHSGKWRSIIGHNYKRITLGYFDTEESAHQAYIEAKRQMHPGGNL